MTERDGICWATGTPIDSVWMSHVSLAPALTGRSAGSGAGPGHGEKATQRLGLADSDLALKVVGLIDETPIIMTGAITRQIVIADLSRVAAKAGAGEADGSRRARRRRDAAGDALPVAVS